MIIDDTIITQVGETAYATWKDAALADLANILCMSSFNQSENKLTGTVGPDGTHVYLPSWYSEIWSIETTSSQNVAYQTTYDRDDGLTPATQYTHTITLYHPYPTGTKFSISGRHGFKRLPAPLTRILAAIIQADQSMADQSDRITSKKIEDVSVTYATTTQTTLEHALTPYRALLDQWKLCHTTTTGGLLSMPTPHHDLPWWMNEQDLGDNDHAIM